ncbi:hypothetical protein BU14_0107s0032 [Porphyra umbilicalis]|uniref:Uncharacterized protein n=1 Tax=Porphyra umbilicalis TaxID=2786 RepID=A0A1X6PCG3_PORUM|nr:hypothetical protein BU14_0107s0032 [Porphyra umbilicalis]|eukprot:OSX78524.1 hypothetical protein BU14_0107s0032 [Porphyra umbilicalis]
MHSRRPFVRHPPPSSLLSAHPPSPAPDPPLRGKQVVHGPLARPPPAQRRPSPALSPTSRAPGGTSCAGVPPLFN